MRKKQSWPLPIAAVFLIVILTALFAEENKKALQVLKVDSVEESIPNASFAKKDLIEKLNKDPQYANLPASEKVRIIVATLRKEERLNSTGKKLYKDSKEVQNNARLPKLKQY